MARTSNKPATEYAQRRETNRGSLAEAIKSGRARFATFTSNNFVVSPGAVTAGANNTIGTGGPAIRPGFRFYVTSFTASADGECMIELNVSADASNTWASGISNGAAGALPYQNLGASISIGSAGGQGTVSWPAGYLVGENSTLVPRYKTSGTTARRAAFTLSGYEVPTDMHPDATVSAVIIGDSLSAGGNLGNDANGRAYLGKWNWHAEFARQARVAGIDYGISANYAEDGRTLEEMAYTLIRGMYAPDWQIMFVALGTNDAASAKYTSTAQTQAWMQEIIDYRDRNFAGEGRKIVFCAPGSTDSTDLVGGTPSRIASVRSAIQAKVASAGGASAGLAFVDWSQAFGLAADPATDTNFKNSERNAGTRLHFSGIGSKAVGQYTFDQTKSFLFGL